MLAPTAPSFRHFIRTTMTTGVGARVRYMCVRSRTYPKLAGFLDLVYAILGRSVREIAPHVCADRPVILKSYSSLCDNLGLHNYYKGKRYITYFSQNGHVTLSGDQIKQPIDLCVRSKC